jgi:hypothetical protein
MNIHELKATDPKGFDKAYAKWCEYEPYDQWWDWTEEAFKEKVKPMGIEVKKIYFNGFYCQGSYARFTGRIDADMFMAHTGLAEKYPALYVAVGQDGSYGTASEGFGRCGVSISYDSHATSTEPSGMFDGLDQDVWEELIEEQERECDIEEAMQELCSDLCSELLRDLQDEREHLTSEASFIDYCESNDEIFEGEETCAT